MKEIEFTKEIKEDLMDNIKRFFVTERGEEISEFQANILLDFIVKSIGPIIYNQAIADAHAFMADRIEEIYGLEKRQSK